MNFALTVSPEGGKTRRIEAATGAFAATRLADQCQAVTRINLERHLVHAFTIRVRAKEKK